MNMFNIGGTFQTCWGDSHNVYIKLMWGHLKWLTSRSHQVDVSHLNKSRMCSSYGQENEPILGISVSFAKYDTLEDNLWFVVTMAGMLVINCNKRMDEHIMFWKYEELQDI